MKILIDSDFLVGFFLSGDAHHQKTKRIYEEFSEKGDIYVSNLVIQETATVISHLVGMDAVRIFSNKFSSLGLIKIDLDKSLEADAWKIFLQQTKKRSSFVDCLNLALIKQNKMDRILSFDKFYPKELRF